MAYDVVKQRYPGAPCNIGARVRHTGTGREGHVIAACPGDDGVRVKFDGSFPPRVCDPRAIAYLDGQPAPGPRWRAK